MAERQITEEERSDLQDAITNSEQKIPIIEFKLKHANLMLSEGLDSNYKETKLKLENDIKEMTRALEFEKKVIQQYKEILEKGNIEVPEKE